MTVRFNPPPGWDTPVGWMPPIGWEKPKSWPEAPPGWEFYSELPPGMTVNTSVRETEKPKNNKYSRTSQEGSRNIQPEIQPEEKNILPFLGNSSKENVFHDYTKNNKENRIMKFVFAVSCITAAVGLLGLFNLFVFRGNGIDPQEIEICYTEVRAQATERIISGTDIVSGTPQSETNALNSLQQNNMLGSTQKISPSDINLIPVVDSASESQPVPPNSKTVAGLGYGNKIPSFNWKCTFVKNGEKLPFVYSKSEITPAGTVSGTSTVTGLR